MFRGPVIDEETAAADAFQRHAGREAEVQHHVIVKRFPGSHRVRIAEDVRQVEIRQMKALGEQAERRARLVIRKSRAPEPWIPWRRNPRQHDVRRVTRQVGNHASRTRSRGSIEAPARSGLAAPERSSAPRNPRRVRERSTGIRGISPSINERGRTDDRFVSSVNGLARIQRGGLSNCWYACSASRSGAWGCSR